MTDRNPDSGEEELELKSKTQLKNESLALQKLGLKLVDLGAAALKRVPMDAQLTEAVELARRINRKKDGFRRQLQYIGKILRNVDIAPIEHALELIENKHQQATSYFHKLEKLRDKLVEEGDSSIQQLIDEHPQLDRQKLRQLVRQTKKQQKENKPPRAAREIFQYLKEQIQET